MSRVLTQRPNKWFGHQTSVEHTSHRTIYRYATFPVEVRRPVEGTRICDITCQACGAHFRLRVRAAHATLRRRMLWLGCAGLGLAVFLASVGVFVTWGLLVPDDNRPHGTSLWTDPDLSCIPAALGLTGVWLFLFLWWQEDGTSLVGLRHGFEHQLVYPKRRRR